ncbi:MAG: DUF4265 domain-containing protein [Polyangiaceae bacterium]
MSSSRESIVSLTLPLEVEDGWPPVSAESLPFRRTTEGYVALVPPLFVKDLSVDDIIRFAPGDAGSDVASWWHVSRSRRSTLWLLKSSNSDTTVGRVLAELRALECNTVGLDQFGVYSVEIPETVLLEDVDKILEHLDADSVAVAFPSMRHEPA